MTQQATKTEDEIPRPEEENILLEVDNLRTYFHTDEGVARAVDGVSWSIPEGKTLGLVGESGCGKSVTALSILRLIQSPPGKIESGEILYRGNNILEMDDRELRHIRGNEISMIFQEPMTSLNPVFTIGNQIIEAITLHQDVSGDEARQRAIEMLRKVNIPDAESRIDAYPHQLSGGMKQRAMIAMALSCNPQVLIADEPTTALDVTIQAQLLELLKELQEEFNMSILLITHDLGVIAELADYVAVMYAGQIQEFAGANTIFNDPKHPYTNGLFESRPQIRKSGQRLRVIHGSVPDATQFPSGCRFHPRCPEKMDHCPDVDPRMIEVEDDHWVRCLLFED